MAKIETYSLDEKLTAEDKLLGSSYHQGSYSTSSYTLGQISEYMADNIGEFKDRWSTISYRFTPQMIYDLGDAESGVLDLDPSSSGTNKHWVLLPGVVDKITCLSRVVFYMKKGSIPYNANYLFSLANYNTGFTGNPSNIQYEWYIYSSNADENSFYKNSGSPGGEYNNAVGKPFMLRVQNSTMMTEGDGEIGIWIEYKYLDVNLDF